MGRVDPWFLWSLFQGQCGGRTNEDVAQDALAAPVIGRPLINVLNGNNGTVNEVEWSVLCMYPHIGINLFGRWPGEAVTFGVLLQYRR